MSARDVLKGVGASPGVAVGRAFVIDRRRFKIPKRHMEETEVTAELDRLEAAIVTSHDQLERVKKKLVERGGDDHSMILEAHQLILRDEHLLGPARRRIREERINAEWALRKTVEEIKSVFDSVEQDYFRERRSDVDFVGERILRNLLGVEDTVSMPPEGAIIVAHDLSPADAAHLHRGSCAAFATDVGGKTSHSSILARAFEIPSVVGLENITDRVATGDLIVVDGLTGEVVVRPAAEEADEYRRRSQKHFAFVHSLMANHSEPAITTDGHCVQLLANIELTEEVPSALEHGAEGIGLYRTEFLYLDRHDLPREEEHYQHARGVVKRMSPLVTTFRTFDLGGDKGLPTPIGVGLEEANPALGLRSIRVCLRERALFKSQLKGLLRASVYGKTRLMFPMISGVGELRAAKAVLEEAKHELDAEKKEYDHEIPVGIMVEMPSAVMIADLLAKEVDFFSIGTNDLIQYALAIDRVNEHVSYLYHPMHPAILRMIQQVVQAAHAANIPVGVCGEMAGEPMFACVLVGFGINQLSMNASAIPIVKSVIRGASLADARALTQRVIALPTAEDIEATVQEYMESRYPEELLASAGESVI